MTCERCGKRPGAIRYTEYSGGEAHRMQVCAECAAELGFGPAPAAPDAAGTPEEAGDGSATSKEGPGRTCPGCGLTEDEFLRESLFGCAECYATFDEDLDLLLRRLHGAVQHRGRVPRSGPAPGPAEAARLRRELDAAVRNGEFEQAARLRDRLRRAGRGGEGPSRPADGPP